jgi:steroid 5-alpha reductase family enzyme
MTPILWTAAVVIFVFVNLVHLLALVKKDNGIMDGAWGLGFILVTLGTLWMADGLDARRLLLGTLVLVWGLRLALHILVRNAGRAGEDFRYRNWRETWGRWFYVRSYFQIYMLQGFFMFIVAAPILFVNAHRGGPLGLLDGIGAAVWLTGFLFEAVGDFQLLRFMKNPANKGRVMRHGVWRYTRHPNYFGEATLWWGCFLIALNVSGGWWALISPLVIDWLLLYVSGIPMLEAKYKDRPEYQDYQRTTNAFFPWFPRNPQ